MKAIKAAWDFITYIFGGLAVVFSFEDDPELWDNPRKRERIRRRMSKERSRDGR